MFQQGVYSASRFPEQSTLLLAYLTDKKEFLTINQAFFVNGSTLFI